MHDKDHQGDHHISDAHERNHETRGLFNALAAAHHADADQKCEHRADDTCRELRICHIETVGLECRLRVVRAEQIKTAGIGEQQEDDENRRESLAL